jgi:aminoglycoside/choline kinase family phosphotransferase
MSDREEAMHAFLKDAGWGDATVEPLPGDASTRRYFRVAMGGRKAMLMDQPQHAEQPTAPANARCNARAQDSAVAPVVITSSTTTSSCP